MKVFISWSGDRSRAVAEVFKGWIKVVIQATDPWVSSKDLGKGSVWNQVLSGELKESYVGIVILTRDNLNAPWILFEAGALSKGSPDSRVCTYLVDLAKSDVPQPLSQFQATTTGKDELRELVKTLNDQLGSSKLDDATLNNAFESNWLGFGEKFEKALAENPSGSTKAARSVNDMIEEVLENTRSILRNVPVIGAIGDFSPKHQSSTKTLLDVFDRTFEHSNAEQRSHYDTAYKTVTWRYNDLIQNHKLSPPHAIQFVAREVGISLSLTNQIIEDYTRRGVNSAQDSMQDPDTSDQS